MSPARRLPSMAASRRPASACRRCGAPAPDPPDPHPADIRAGFTSAVRRTRSVGMSNPTAAPAFLTTKEVAELLRVRERKVYEMAAEGEIPCRRVTGKLLFPRAELDVWLSGGVSTPAEALPEIVAGSHDPLLEWAIRESGSGLATFF